MSGTSGDGVDAVMLELEDLQTRHAPAVLGHAYIPFDDSLRAELTDPTSLTLERVAQLHFLVPNIYAEAVRRLPNWEQASVIGMHGQTLWHAPPSQGPAVPCTLQIGSSAVLAAAVGIPVVGDLRCADVARGGEGAPIIPLAHWFFCAEGDGTQFVVNIGGIANYTCVTPALDDVRASDLGPGMMITDALSRHVSAGAHSFDRDGTLSQGGTPHVPFVEHVLGHEFFTRGLPRSTGREDFGHAYVEQLLDRFSHLTGPDLLASSVDATAASIVRAAEHDAPDVTRVVLTGGGALHPKLAPYVRARASHLDVSVATEGVLAPMHHEPAGMALIAARTLARLPSSVPAITGASTSSVLGHICAPP
ncbi:MAG: anhydro-N-acetylmuramic acid kinase [Myxococcota bacterium]